MTSPGSVEFDFGDGTALVPGIDKGNGRWVAEHAYADYGRSYTVTATDDVGSDSISIHVPEPPPVPVPEITNVTPAQVDTNVASSFTATGKLLDTTDGVTLEGPTPVTGIVPTGVTATGFSFDATITADGTYDVVALAGGAELARWSAINSGAVVVSPDLLTITPTTVEEDVSTTFTVTGTNLAGIDAADLDGAVTIVGLTDTGYTFTKTLPTPGTYDHFCSTGGVEDDRLTAAVEVTAAVVTGTITLIDPRTVIINVGTDIVVTGTGLGTVDAVRLEGAGNTIPGAATAISDTEVHFTATWPDAGQYDVILLAGTQEVAREDNGITAVANVSFYRIIPSTTPADVLTSYRVEGIGLSQIDHIELRDVNVTAGGQIDDIAVVHLTEHGNQEYALTFEATLTVQYPHHVNGHDAAHNDLAWLTQGIRVTDDPTPPTLTSITPASVTEDVSTTFTVVGTNLGTVTEANLGGIVTIENLTETGFTFTKAMPTIGTYDLIVEAGGSEVDRLVDAVEVTAVVLPTPVLTSITPTQAPEDIITAYTVVGTELATIEGAKLGTSGVAIKNLTDTGFSFDSQQYNPGLLDLTVTRDSVEVARLDDCVEIISPVDLLAITPDWVYEGAAAVEHTLTWTVGSGVDPTTAYVYPDGSTSADPAMVSFPVTVTGPGVCTVLLDVSALPWLEDDYSISVGQPESDELAFEIREPVGTITSVTPVDAEPKIKNSFVAVGTGLVGTASVKLVSGGNELAATNLTNVTDTGFEFDVDMGNNNGITFDLVAYHRSDKVIARLGGAIRCIYGPPLLRLTEVSPTSGELWISAYQKFTVRGTELTADCHAQFTTDQGSTSKPLTGVDSEGLSAQAQPDVAIAGQTVTAIQVFPNDTLTPAEGTDIITVDVLVQS